MGCRVTDQPVQAHVASGRGPGQPSRYKRGWRGGEGGVLRTTPTSFHASSESPYGYSLSTRTSTGRPCPTMRSNVVLSRSCMLKRRTVVRSGGQEAQERPGDVGQADTKLPRPGACAAEGTPLRQVKPLQHRVSRCRLRSKGALTTLRCEDAVVGSGWRGEREHESRDAPAEHAEVPLEGMGALCEGLRQQGRGTADGTRLIATFRQELGAAGCF